ncbi:hypothetical protein Tco_0333428, partial [Tanacetum coccineum]
AGSNPGNAVKFQPQPSHVVHARPNLEPMDLAVTDASTQQNPEQMDEEFTTTAYPMSNAVDEIVTNAVDWAHQALLRASFRDLPKADMKELLLQ